ARTEEEVPAREHPVVELAVDGPVEDVVDSRVQVQVLEERDLKAGPYARPAQPLVGEVEDVRLERQLVPPEVEVHPHPAAALDDAEAEGGPVVALGELCRELERVDAGDRPPLQRRVVS